MANTNYYVSYSKTNEIMWRDGDPGTWSIKGEYSGIKIGNTFTYLIHRTDSDQNRLLKQSDFPTKHVLTHIHVGNATYEVGD